MRVIERYEATQHHVHNQLVTLDGGEAEVETYGVACHVYVRDGVKRKLDWGCAIAIVAWSTAARGASPRARCTSTAQDLPLEG